MAGEKAACCEVVGERLYDEETGVIARTLLSSCIRRTYGDVMQHGLCVFLKVHGVLAT